ncbi:MAG: hypothetical protein V4525_08860 [Pseudomonadota bacterium]
MRRFILVLMLLILPWKAFASTVEVVWNETSHLTQTIEHEMEHEKGIAHHHHNNDHSIHYDDSEASKKHFNDHLFLHHMAAYEIGLSANILPTFFVFPSVQASVWASAPLFPTSTFLEGLRRPPRILS